MELGPSDFSGFFRAIHDHDPFPWQQALVEQLAERDEWPDVLDLPTGAGKTAALDAAVFHLALRADEPGKAALRIALVVDRRLVVDDAFAHAERIVDSLRGALRSDADVDDVLKEVACRLRRLAGKDAKPLIAQQLRGGAPLEHDWARTPTQPTILCSTVDQVGSRLLFRGYGVSDRMKPVHAGLLGMNSLILLDEAHLSEPFRQTLAAVRCVGGAKVKLALLSATPGATASRPFPPLSLADRAHPVLTKRLQAPKPAALTVERGKDAVVARTFAETARAMMGRLKERGVSPPAVGVVVNRVALARMIYEELDSKREDGDEPNDGVDDAILLIGRCRDMDRSGIMENLTPFKTDAKIRSEASPLFVVATQCLEVGVDLDLDGLVTQAASLDSLRQRFGRLNRAGRPVPAEGAILGRSEDIAKKADDPVYGDRIRLTWEALQGIATDGNVDFGVEVLPKRLKEAGIDQDGLVAQRPDAPVVMPAYLDLWSQTWPRPAADPDVSLFLHGAERTAAGISIVWRGDISEDDLKGDSSSDLHELVRLFPPRAAEAVEVPPWTARSWLRQVRDEPAHLSDAPERAPDEPGAVWNRRAGRSAFRWAGADDPRTGVVEPKALRPGDMVIVPAEYGGCDAFGWAPESVVRVKDVADAAAKPWWGRRCAVRIAPDIVRTDAQWDRLSTVLADDGVAGPDLVERLLDAVPPAGTMEDGEGAGDDGPPTFDVRETLEALRRARKRIDVHFPYGGGRGSGAVLVAVHGVRCGRSWELGAPATEDDIVSHTAAEPVPLDDHGCRVADFAERFAETLGLEDVADDLRLAAFLHDAGKADPRFQTMLSGGDPWNRPDGPPLAKSGRTWLPSAGERSGLPKGWRHEALSVRMARAHPRFADAHDPALVLWLIGSHHGFGRPFFNFLDPASEQKPLPCLGVDEWRLATAEPGPHSLAFDFSGADWPSLFEGLKRRHGAWGLAHLETILRLADHRASEEEGAS